MELHGALNTVVPSLAKTKSSNPTTHVLGIGNGTNKKKNFSHVNGKSMVGSSNKGLKRKTTLRLCLTLT